MKWLAALILCGCGMAEAKEYKSSHIRHFDIRQCRSGTDHCFEAAGELAFVSRDGSLISAAATRLKMTKNGSEESLSCTDFTYNVLTQTVRCDQDALATKSVIIDQDFKVSRYGF